MTVTTQLSAQRSTAQCMAQHSTAQSTARCTTQCTAQLNALHNEEDHTLAEVWVSTGTSASLPAHSGPGRQAHSPWEASAERRCRSGLMPRLAGCLE